MQLLPILAGLLLSLSLIRESEQAKGLMRNRRSIILANKKWLWPDNTIKYTFETRDAARVSAVEITIAEFEDRSCLKFQKVSRNAPGYKIVVTDKYRGCFTSAGYHPDSKEMQLNLGRGCETLGIARHEWQHVMGVMHQQSAPDRDNYIKFHPENVFHKSWVSQFKKVDPPEDFTYHGGRYDFRSSMHYGSAAAAKSGKETMVALTKENRNMIDHRYNHHLSYGDLRLINKAYNCGDKCSGSCSGYFDKNCKCVTPNDPIFGGNSLTNLRWPPKKPSRFLPFMRSSVIKKVMNGQLSVTKVKSELPGETYQPVAGKTNRKACQNGMDVYYEKTSNQFLVALKSSRPPAGCFIGNRYLHPNRHYGENRVSGVSDVYKRAWLLFYFPDFKPKVVL